MLALGEAFTLALLLLCCFIPGFSLVRRLAWSPLEKLSASIGLSLILLYLVTWEYYCLMPAGGAGALYAVPAIAAALAWLVRADLARWMRSRAILRTLGAYAFLFAWTLLMLSMIRNYSGGGWSGDWVEHFQRALFFLHRFPTQTPLYGGYSLPARPPMMNVLGAFFLGQTQDRFEIFQVVFAFLNLLVFLPCCLIMPALSTPRKSSVAALAALFALNPMMMVAATYAWTKSLTAFFVVTAFWFYLAGWRKNDPWRTTAAFVAMSAGILVHYSAGPYMVFLALHYLIAVFPRRRNWRELAVLTAASAALLATWFSWSLATYGIHGTLAANSSVTSSQSYQGSNVEKILANILDSIVPRLLREPSAVHDWDQPSLPGQIRDVSFLSYQPNFILGIGSVAGPLVVWILYLAFRKRSSAERRFWRAMVPLCLVAGVAVIGERDLWGSAHLLLPPEFLGLALLAASLPLRRAAAVALLAGCAVDFSLGVFLQMRVQNLENDQNRTVFADFGHGAHRSELSAIAFANWFEKHWYNLEAGQVREAASGAAPEAALNALDAEDGRLWQGWYGRHGGSIGFLGDHLANSWFGILDLQSVVLLILFAGVMRVLWKQCSPTSRPRAASSATPRKPGYSAPAGSRA